MVNFMPDTRQVAELYSMPSDFIADLSRRSEVRAKFGEATIISPDVLLYRNVSRKEAYAIGTLICGVIESDDELHGTDTMNGLVPIAGAETRPFTAFSTTSLDIERLKNNANKAILFTNTNLALMRSPLRIQ
jgi:hypothetical protein